MLKDGDRVTAGSQGRTVATSGNDLLRLEPKTTITIEAQKTGDDDHRTARWDAARQSRQAEDGDTLSIETQYLVATVKGTEFEVATTEWAPRSR